MICLPSLFILFYISTYITLSSPLFSSLSLLSLVPVFSNAGQQYVNQWLRPHFWYVVYADPNTCQESPPIDDIHVGYTLTFLNPDSYGVANDHFGEDEKGMYVCMCVCI